MLKKTSDDVKKRIVFFMDFSSIFREKSTEDRAKSVKTSLMHKNRRKITFGTPFFTIFFLKNCNHCFQARVDLQLSAG